MPYHKRFATALILLVMLVLTGTVSILYTSSTGGAGSPPPLNYSDHGLPHGASVSLARPGAAQAQPLVPAQTIPTQATRTKELIQQRDQLYKNFEEISTGLGQGQQPDFRQINTLLVQQRELVKAGILSSEEAITYSQFLRQILPAMDQQLYGHIEQLKSQQQAN